MMPVASQKKPEPAFIIRLVGRGVSPWAVPMRSLTSVLQAVQRLVEQRDDFVDDLEAEAEVHGDSGIVLHLLNVKSGSAAYAVAAPDHDGTVAMFRRFRESLDHP